MTKYSRQDILNMIHRENIECIAFPFTNAMSRFKSTIAMVIRIAKDVFIDCKLAYSNVDSYKGMRYEEMFLDSNLSAFVIFPFIPQVGRFFHFFSEVVKPEGTPFKGDSNYIWKKQLDRYIICDMFLT